MSITPKNWDTFQHYKDRKPSWIKLHKELLDNYDYARLPVASRALAPMLWLLASEYDDGKITATNDEIAFRFRMSENEMLAGLNPLIESGFFLSDSKPLAGCKRAASLEKETEKQVEKETEGAEAPAKTIKKDRRRATQIHDDRKANHSLGLKANLTNTETDREFEKFRNHAKSKGRTCIDWDAAEQNWYYKAAEFMGRKPPPKPGSGPQSVFVDADDPAFAAWESFTGRRQSRNKNGGWYFPTKYPPGFEPQKEAAE